jgi:hypothetical protein
MIGNPASSTEFDILAQVVMPKEPSLQADLARCILDMQFGEEATTSIRALMEKNNRGTISDAEKHLLERYLRVGEFIDMLRAKARISLQEIGQS